MKVSTKTFLAFGVTLSFGIPISAQSTWNNLQFGMSKADVTTALASKGMTVSQSGQDVLLVQPTYQLNLPTIIKPIPFRVDLVFSIRGLQQVGLLLDTQSWIQTAGSIESAIDVSNQEIKNALTAKYGRPISATSACDLSGNGMVDLLFDNETASCKSSWRSEGQLITVSWNYFKQEKSFSYSIVYQASTSDL